jgi:acetylornithine/N-succinyldiaminopimelate aminotransferase
MALSIPAGPLVSASHKLGLLLINAGPDVMRFVPPLVIQKQHVDTMVEKLTTVLSEADNV